MSHNNSARCLYNILKEALNTEDESKFVYLALASALKIEDPEREKYKYIDFLKLIGDVEISVKKLKRIPDLDEYVSSIQELAGMFLTYGIFQTQWSTITSIIRGNGTLKAINACAMFIQYEQIHPDLSSEH
jgi:hypothetical protein